MKSEAIPLTGQDYGQLEPFVEEVEVKVEEYDTKDGRKGARRVGYYRLNERGLKIHNMWETGMLEVALEMQSKGHLKL